MKPDDNPRLGHEVGVVEELEVAHPVRRQPVRAPDALHRGDANADQFGPGRQDPVGGLARRLRRGQRHHAVGHRLLHRLHPRPPLLVPQQAVDAGLGKAFLPSPHAGLRIPRSPHDLDRAEARRNSPPDSNVKCDPQGTSSDLTTLQEAFEASCA